jgi:hypothetical protein
MTIDHGRIKALFQAAIDREDPAERLEYLDREIGNDTDLRDRLDDLLAVYDRPPAALPRRMSGTPTWDSPRCSGRSWSG